MAAGYRSYSKGLDMSEAQFLFLKVTYDTGGYPDQESATKGHQRRFQDVPPSERFDEPSAKKSILCRSLQTTFGCDHPNYR